MRAIKVMLAYRKTPEKPELGSFKSGIEMRGTPFNSQRLEQWSRLVVIGVVRRNTCCTVL